MIIPKFVWCLYFLQNFHIHSHFAVIYLECLILYPVYTYILFLMVPRFIQILFLHQNTLRPSDEYVQESCFESLIEPIPSKLLVNWINISSDNGWVKVLHKAITCITAD